MTDALTDPTTGEPLIVPRGIFDTGLQQSVDAALKRRVSPDHRFAFVAVVDKEGRRVTGRAGVVVKLDKKGNWAFSAEGKKVLNGPVSGQLMLVGTI